MNSRNPSGVRWSPSRVLPEYVEECKVLNRWKTFVSTQLLLFSDGYYTLNIYKASQGSIVIKNLSKLLEQVIDFCKVRVHN